MRSGIVKLWKVTLNGKSVIQRFITSEAEAHRIAERWQGQHGGYYGGAGLLNIKDRGDWVEVKRDLDGEREMDERADEAVRGNPQKIPYILEGT